MHVQKLPSKSCKYSIHTYNFLKYTCTCIYSENFWTGLCIQDGGEDVEGNTILTPKSVQILFLKIKRRGAFTSLASLLLCTGLVLSILINIFLFPCNSKIVQPQNKLFFSRVYGFITGNVFPKIVFHEKQYFYVPPTLLGDIQTSDTKFSAYDIRMFLEYK